MSEQIREMAVGVRKARIMVREAWKRSFDVFVAVVGLILLTPIFAVVGVLIKLDSPGPVFYRGKRAARGGGTFEILKFRTMYESPESYQGPRVTAQGDPRVTAVGAWLRDTKLNELPQLLNVLKGEMSLVGPRPEDPEIVKTWTEAERREILSVRPGISSPASVLYRDEETMLQQQMLMETYFGAIVPNKLRLDQLYVRNRSFLMDLDVILWTFLALIPRIRSYKPSELWLFWGPISKFVRRYFNWFVIDTSISLIAIAASGVFWRTFGPLNVGWPKAVLVALGFAVLFSLVASRMGVQQIVWTQANSSDALELLPPTFLAAVVALVINQFAYSKHPLLPPGLILMATALALFGFLSVRFRKRLWGALVIRMMQYRPSANAVMEKVLIVGGGMAGHFAAWLLNHNSRNPNGLHIVGFVDDDLFKQGARIQGIKVIGRRDDILELVEKHDVGVIVFAIHQISHQEQAAMLDICSKTTAQVILFPDFLGALNASLAYQASNGRQIGDISAQFVMASPGLAFGQVDYWLAGLATLAERGEREEILRQISELRGQLQPSEIHPEFSYLPVK